MSFAVPKNSYIRDTSHRIRGTFVLTKKANVLKAEYRYAPEPPVPRSIDIMREYYDWILVSFFTKIKYQAPELTIF